MGCLFESVRWVRNEGNSEYEMRCYYDDVFVLGSILLSGPWSIRTCVTKYESVDDVWRVCQTMKNRNDDYGVIPRKGRVGTCIDRWSSCTAISTLNKSSLMQAQLHFYSLHSRTSSVLKALLNTLSNWEATVRRWEDDVLIALRRGLEIEKKMRFSTRKWTSTNAQILIRSKVDYWRQSGYICSLSFKIRTNILNMNVPLACAKRVHLGMRRLIVLGTY